MLLETVLFYTTKYDMMQKFVIRYHKRRLDTIRYDSTVRHPTQSKSDRVLHFIDHFDLHLGARQCVTVVFCDGCADDRYTRQFEDRSRVPADVSAEKVDVGTLADAPIVR
jgi:hypothetical protein